VFCALFLSLVTSSVNSFSQHIRMNKMLFSVFYSGHTAQNGDVLVVEDDVGPPDAVDWNTHVIQATEQFRIPAK